ncbi:MAG: hypothetical protein LBL87_07975 [Ruminococcus sp.]|jgi:hypothetical protein|nr:hypothetical protein [Ruminococcus sp.]
MKTTAKMIIAPIFMFSLAFLIRFSDGQPAVAVYSNISERRENVILFDNRVPTPKRIVLPTREIKPTAPALSLSVPDIDTDFKAYMDYRTITDKSAPQWRYREIAYTDSYGFRRIVDDYVVALGTYYCDEVGQRFRITLDSGKAFTVIAGDIKDPAHTDPDNMYTPVYGDGGSLKSGCVIEFLVDTRKLDKEAVTLGTVSCYSALSGNIEKIEKI